MVRARAVYQRANRLLFEIRERARTETDGAAHGELAGAEQRLARAMANLCRAERSYLAAREQRDRIAL